MCGRYNLNTPAAQWTQALLPLWTDQERTGRIDELSIHSRYNVAPGQPIACVRSQPGSEKRDLAMLHWGLIPHWATDAAIGYRMINARSETVAEKNAFKSALKTQRCLIPADGYFEWVKTDHGKQPYWIRDPSGQLLVMAGLWQRNEHVADQPVESATVLTTNAGPATAEIHDRMPVFLTEAQAQLWLDQEVQDASALKPLYNACQAMEFSVDPVSTYVSRSQNEGPRCIEIEKPLQQGELF
ncbi:Putative SOS response-associated peptidase YedK [Stieleria bergensis]|uniref:Abasic site processing protein n=1 Tax=Stieleria bergensis TaxID=2528025 RepID=A0A517T0U8_9BACT|nr:Putative SOS response-associated peptidase YedK [Planctomycetes bacterium SV_7m_r]